MKVTATFDIADRYVGELAAADPFTATFAGITGHEAEVTDFSPAGVERRAELNRRTLSALESVTPENVADRIAHDLMAERLRVAVDLHDAGEDFRELRTHWCPVQMPRQALDLAATDTPHDWENIAARLEGIPGCLDGATRTYREGLARGLPAARRQAIVCAGMAEVWAGLGGGTPYFRGLAARAPRGRLGERIRVAASAAASAYADLARFLREEYAPRASEEDSVGRERYAMAARQSLGASIDLEETYAWGWEELHRLERAMDGVAERIMPGASRQDAIQRLRTDPARSIRGIENLLAFLQETTDRAITELAGRHFDIPEPLRRCECMEAPPGGAAAMYYTPPAEDFSRPGRTWYPAMGREVFPVWVEVTTAYHEGVPGHHLQLGTLRLRRDRLSRYQSTLGFISGHGEGWALYSEQLMHELGFFENPDYEMGFLQGQLFRAMRIVVDIGMHLGLRIPDTEAQHPGERWAWDSALSFVNRYAPIAEEFAKSELERYLGMPAQAISYKVGQREWLNIREARRKHDGAGFDLKRFHMDALSMGPMGLEQMRKELMTPAPASSPATG